MKRLIISAGIAVVLVGNIAGCSLFDRRRGGDACCPCEQPCGGVQIETAPTYIETTPAPTGTLPGPARTTPG